MRGDMGLATLIIFIVIVLMATIAAVVLLQATNAVKNQALMTQQESRAKFSRKLVIEQMKIIADTFLLVENNAYNPYYKKGRVLWIWVRVPAGGYPVDLRKVSLTYESGDVIKIAHYIDADGDEIFGENACETTSPYPWPTSKVAYLFRSMIGPREENTEEMSQGVNYDALIGGDAFTAVWVPDCDGHNEDYLIYPGQTVILIYMPPNGIPEGAWFKITLTVPDGAITTVETKAPDVYSKIINDVPV